MNRQSMYKIHFCYEIICTIVNQKQKQSSFISDLYCELSERRTGQPGGGCGCGWDTAEDLNEVPETELN